MSEVFCDRWFDTEETSSVIEAVYYSSERKELFVQLVPCGTEPGVLAGYRNVPDNVFTALEVLNGKRLGGDEGSSVGRYWNCWIKAFFEGLPTDDVEVLVQDDIDRRQKLFAWSKDVLSIEETEDAAKAESAPQYGVYVGDLAADATIAPVSSELRRFGVVFDDDGTEHEVLVKATNVDDALVRFNQAIEVLGWDDVEIIGVIHFFN